MVLLLMALLGFFLSLLAFPSLRSCSCSIDRMLSGFRRPDRDPVVFLSDVGQLRWRRWLDLLLCAFLLLVGVLDDPPSAATDAAAAAALSTGSDCLLAAFLVSVKASASAAPSAGTEDTLTNPLLLVPVLDRELVVETFAFVVTEALSVVFFLSGVMAEVFSLLALLLLLPLDLLFRLRLLLDLLFLLSSDVVRRWRLFPDLDLARWRRSSSPPREG